MFSEIKDLMMRAALRANTIILDIYQRQPDISYKRDHTPVTNADADAEQAILAVLEPLGIPILAEESVAAGRIPALGDKYFIVDPLDGTREFIKRNGEFTVNIAYIEHGAPLLGIITAPAHAKGYFADEDSAFSFTIEHNAAPKRAPLHVNRNAPMNVVASRSHGHKALAALSAEMNVADDLSVGSSLKFCQLAAGEARLYPRFTPTCEWDTAAGQAILERAGGAVVTLDGEPLRYGKIGDRFLNPFFAAADDLALARDTAKIMNRLINQ